MKLLIIAIAALSSVYKIVLCLVKLRSAKNPTPASVSDVYDPETYEKWRRYSFEHAGLSIIFGVISMAVTIVLLAANVYSRFAMLFPNNLYMQLFAVILLESAVDFVLNIPKSYISTMVIEEKYGFNRTKMKTFVADRIRELIFGLLFSLSLAVLVAVCHISYGDYMAIVCGVVLIVFAFVMSAISPVFSRIGNKFTPLEEGELRDRLMGLLTRHGYSVRAIEVMDASRRTTKMNAYFTGIGKMKRIVLFDNLVNAMTADEICAVFAHELGHGLHKDTVKLQFINTLNFVLISVMAWLLVSVEALYSAFGFEGLNYGFAFILIGIAFSVVNPFLGIFSNAVSRRFEYRADRQAVKEGYGEAMIPALKKLARDNFAELAPSPLYVILEYSHPPIHKRITAIREELDKK
ncbi:MAG: M48 family metallopeptidase [Eubacteriales bacterium]